MLPINQIKTDFLAHIGNNNNYQPIIVSANTGTGKSTQLPKWCTHTGKVLVIEPRRIACTSLAERVANEMKTPLGEKVGYAIRFEIQANDNSEIVFVTPGVALRWLNEGLLDDFNAIMLDEFHERRWDTDLLLALLLEHNKTSYQPYQLVITSATLNAQQLINYCEGIHLHAEGKVFPVDEHYLAPAMRDMPHKDNLTERMAFAAEKAYQLGSQDVLTFLPGKGEIQLCANYLRARMSDQFDIITLHGASPISEQKRALQQGDKRRLILATNVAETSLTIPGVDVVIDSGLERRTHIRNGQSVLDLTAIANDSKLQRRGRAGRIKQGVYLALFGQHAPLEAHTPPEIQRENLTDMMLAAAANNNALGNLRFINSLSQQAHDLAFSTLKTINAINDTGTVTDYGKALAPLPIDVSLSHLVASMPNNRLKQAMADLAGALSVPAKLYTLDKNSEKFLQLESDFPDLCDFSLLIGLVRGQFLEYISAEENALIEAKQFASQLRSHFDLPELSKYASYNITELQHAIAALLPSCVYIKKQNRRGSYNNGQQEVVIAKDSYLSNEPDALLVLKTYSLAGRAVKDRKTLATKVSPITTSVIIDNDLGEAKLCSSEITEQNELIGNYHYQYAGTLLKSFSALIKSHEFTAATVNLIETGALCESLFEKLTQEFQQLCLYQNVHSTDWQLLAPHEHIARVLSDLEISSLDELALLDNSDFAYGLVDDYTWQQFCELYPLTVVLPQQQLRVEYFISAKRVVLHYISGKRVEAPKKWELPNFNGAKIQYRRASKLVDIK
ncbi:helicase-related protein [Pseudoalteromonas spongiae]|uniref:Helicase-related protein n=1 Tax=Pseudoalteromonas spongiae TaxID=298657 RepID=A0ABU8EQG0_9GAMM